MLSLHCYVYINKLLNFNIELNYIKILNFYRLVYISIKFVTKKYDNVYRIILVI